MRRTLTLIGFLTLGVLLLVNPVTGILSPPSEDPTTTVAAATTLPTTTTEAPPDGTEATTTLATTTTTTTIAVETVVAGPQVWSEWGYFQVEITVAAGVMTDIELIKQPSDRKSVRINDSATPRYVAQALELQSTDLDMISGATFTWRYFRESLAGAMGEAGLAQPVSA